MSINLLDKTRKVNTFVHKNASKDLDLSGLCSITAIGFAGFMGVFDMEGHILGLTCDMQEFLDVRRLDNEGVLSPLLNSRLLNAVSTKENIAGKVLGFEDKFCALITPIYAKNQRLGSAFCIKKDSSFDVDDIILVEYTVGLIGMELSAKDEYALEKQLNDKDKVLHALHSLSAKEQTAISAVFSKIEGLEGVLNIKSISENAGITRSQILNAIKKFESAGIIKTTSLGVKGTKIEIIAEKAKKMV